jgi:hypothetical protein
MTFRTLTRARVVRRSLCVAGGVLLLACAAALAATPETPQVKVRYAESSAVSLLGILNPGKAGEAGTYEFLYKAGGSCEGGNHTTPGISLGAQGEEVYERIEGLTAQSEYTVCLIARNGGEKAQSAPVTIVTGPPETPQTLPASEITASTAQLNGVLNPGKKGEADTYEFLYKQSASECATNRADREKGIPEGLSTGASPEPVSTKVSGLLPGTKYTFCLRTLNAGEEEATGPPETFETVAAPPIVRDESVSEVASTSATISAQIGSGGRLSAYRVEYGPSESYGSSTPEASIGSPEAFVGVRQRLTGLQPGTLYHFRFTATNALGAKASADATFTTPAAGGPTVSTLPDDRVYEDVSLAADSAGGEVYPPFTGHERNSDPQIDAHYPVRAAADGDAVAYAGEAPAVGGSGSTGQIGGDTFLATRSAGGWEPLAISPPIQDSRGVYQGFSSDLSLAFLTEFDTPLTPDAPSPCDVLYARDVSGYHPQFTSTETPGNCGAPKFAGVSEDASSVIFETPAPLTATATQGDAESGQETQNLYDATGGRLYQVNVLPEGTPAVNAAFGGIGEEPHESKEPRESQGNAGYRHYGGAISADGSRLVWTDLNTDALYVREDPASPAASTVLVAEDAYFRGASSDGSKIFFTDERRLTADSGAEPGAPDLYECELEGEGQPCKLTDLSPDAYAGEPADALGVLGNSQDGAYVYFVAKGALAPGATPQQCQVGAGPEAEGCNLYLYHAGDTRFIATLSAKDDAIYGAESVNVGPMYGDWRPGLNTRIAEVTPSGGAVLFMSHRSLTGYDSGGLLEVFTYDADSGRLACASCDPTGALPAITTFSSPGRAGAQEAAGGSLMTPGRSEETSSSEGAAYQLRMIADNGGRVFFDSYQPLVPQADPGVEGVYEWEREGEGTCSPQTPSRIDGGCIFLISGASSDEESVFVDADVEGRNVFFTTRAQLAGEDQNQQVDLYDARVDGGIAHVSTACTGTGCQGVPPAPPSFATPASATFNGIGNFPPPAQPKVVAKSLTRAQKLANALKACKKDRQRRKRKRCEGQARASYGSALAKHKSRVGKPGVKRRVKS